VLVIVVGVTVLLSTTYYGAFILNGLIVKDLPALYTVDGLIDKLYANELQAMFWSPS
jgi:hypothetical protein